MVGACDHRFLMVVGVIIQLGGEWMLTRVNLVGSCQRLVFMVVVFTIESD